MKHIRLALVLGAAFALNLLNSSFAIGLIIVDQENATILPPPRDLPPPRWLPRPIHRFTPLEIRSAKVSADIKDQVARTKIEQEFYNPNPRQLEGTFILPLPKGAHLEKFRMEVNGKMTEAELLSADKAKDIYEEIVRKAKDPALLEYVGRDLLKVRIFPIEPNSTKKVEVSYTQLLKNDSGLVDYSLPINMAKYSRAPIKSFSLKLNLESSTPLKTIYSPSHSVEVLRNTSKTAVIGLEQNDTKPDKDFQLFYSAQQNELGVSFLTYKKGAEDGYFMLIASPGFDSGGKVLPKDVVFVLDTSGSMSGKKLDQAKKALLFCVNNLNEQDRFEVIRFASDTESLFKKLTDVSKETRAEAETFVTHLRPLGGTAINDALKKALEIRPKETSRPYIVVFLTDGLPTVGETSEDAIVKTVKEQDRALTRIFCFGIGTDVNTHLLDRIAEDTSAVSQYVLPDEDLEVKLSSFFSKINDPVLAGVELDLGKIRANRIHPGKLPDLFKGQQLIVLGRYHETGATTAKVTGKVGEQEKEFTYKLNFPESSGDHEFIPRLWATRRVGYLLDEIRLRGENAELKDEVTELARKYGIVTPYTSFLVQEDQPLIAQRPEILLRESLHPAKRPARASTRANSPGPAQAPAESLPQLLLRSEAKSGDTAVAGARYSSSLRLAESEQQALAAGRELRDYATTGKLQSSAGAGFGGELPSRNAGGKTFHLEGNTWTETTINAAKDAKIERLEFDSPDYWKFATAHPELKDILALGTNLRFLLEAKIIEIFVKN